ncbi:MAG TPA: M42 family metallopeptidase, partial [Chloroflexota bacterium]|nr:M42 family metallopeptidase [Chloroflexota bacterium]
MAFDFELLKRLCETPGVASRETQIRSIAVESLRPLVDDIRIDALGNAIGRKPGTGNRRVMVAAHVDEIGFLVRHVDSNGFLKLQPIGGFDPRALFAQRVLVTNARGETLRGALMPGAKPIHLMAGEEPKAPKVDDYFVDLGLTGDAAREAVEVGDMVTLERTVERVGGNVIGKAMDDRVGVYVMIQALRQIQSHEADIFAIATVQEEIGLRGAVTSAYDVEPDIGIALDVTLALDFPGTAEGEIVSRLGKGAAIKIMDSSLICDPRLVRQFRDIAQRENIPHQLEILPRGGTDAGAIQRSRAGVPSITLSIPARYVHTVNEIVSESDVEACATLL